ncbi:MAG: NUDIX domain-containing protein [Candidatus Saccharimonadales bacterium]
MKKIIPKDAVLLPDKAKRVFKGEIFDVYQWPQPMFDGSTATFEMLRRPDTVEAICIVDDKLLLLDDEQPHRGSRLSFPGGRVDEADVDILSAAKREMLEETGYQFKTWKLLLAKQPHTKIEWFIYLFVASDGQKLAVPRPDAGERISCQALAFDDVKELSLGQAGYLGNAQDIFKLAHSIEELAALPEFSGQEVDS